MAAKIGVAVSLDEVSLQGPDRLHIAVIHRVRVPGGRPAVPVTVEEDDGCREIVVVVDDVFEVRETFATLVHRGMTGGVGVVDGVNEISPSAVGGEEKSWLVFAVHLASCNKRIKLTRRVHC